MPFRHPLIHETAQDLEDERSALRARAQRRASHNPIKRTWWWITGIDRGPLFEDNDPPASWRRIPARGTSPVDLIKGVVALGFVLYCIGEMLHLW